MEQLALKILNTALEAAIVGTALGLVQFAIYKIQLALRNRSRHNSHHVSVS